MPTKKPSPDELACQNVRDARRDYVSVKAEYDIWKIKLDQANEAVMKTLKVLDEHLGLTDPAPVGSE